VSPLSHRDRRPWTWQVSRTSTESRAFSVKAVARTELRPQFGLSKRICAAFESFLRAIQMTVKERRCVLEVGDTTKDKSYSIRYLVLCQSWILGDSAPWLYAYYCTASDKKSWSTCKTTKRIYSGFSRFPLIVRRRYRLKQCLTDFIDIRTAFFSCFQFCLVLVMVISFFSFSISSLVSFFITVCFLNFDFFSFFSSI